MTRIKPIPLSLVTLLMTAATVAGGHLRYEDMLDHLTNLDRLPAIEAGVTCGQFSSYDRASQYDAATDTYIRWDANGDAGNYLRIDPDTQEGVMAEMNGPGCIFRIWSANPQGVIRFYLDGDTKPTYEWDFHKLCTGEVEPFLKPLVWKRDPAEPKSASNIYLPIPYNKSCKVTALVHGKNGPKPPRQYYIINYRSFPSDSTVDTFKLPLTDAQQTAVKRTADAWTRPGKVAQHPLDHFDTRKLIVAPGKTVNVTELAGPAVIRQFKAKCRSDEEWATRRVILKVYWDGQSTPAIDCPIGDFFGEPKDVPYKSYPMGIGEHINYCLFPMPFHQSARVEVTNDGEQPAEVEFILSYRKEEVPDNWAQFHAKFRCEIESATFDYPLIEATGTGKLVGICLFPDNIEGGWWGEGDEKVYVDGEKFPSWFGTGSEDYFGDAWGIRCFHNPSHGFPQKTVERLQGCYRWHLADNIPYTKSFKMTIENYTGKPAFSPRNDYYSVAYWYQMPGGSDFFTETPVADRVPRDYVANDALEAERCVDGDDLPAGMTILYDKGLPRPLSSSRGVKFTGKVGDTFTINVPIAVADYYAIDVHTARGLKASSFEVLMDGKPIAKRPKLRVGDNPITFRLTGKPIDGGRCEVIIDYLLVQVYRNPITQWMMIAPFPNTNGSGYEEVFPPEKDTSAVDLTAKFPGRDGVEAGWKKIESGSGIVSLIPHVKPIEGFVAYAACIVTSPTADKRDLLVGSDDGIKVWLNGQLVHSLFDRRSCVPDHDETTIHLKEGDNLLLIKLEQAAGDASWYIRFRDPNDELTYSLPE